jgi:hypothetical protein
MIVFEEKYKKIFDVCSCGTEFHIAFVKNNNAFSYTLRIKNIINESLTLTERVLTDLVQYRETNVSYDTRLELRKMNDIDYDQACVQISFLKNNDMLIANGEFRNSLTAKSVYKNTRNREIEQLFLSGLRYESIINFVDMEIPQEKLEYEKFIYNAKNLPLDMMEILYEKPEAEEKPELLFFEKSIMETLKSRDHVTSCSLYNI